MRRNIPRSWMTYGLIVLALLFDSVSIGFWGCRLIHWTRGAYLATLVTHQSVMARFCAAWTTAIMAILFQASVIDELCFCLLFAVVAPRLLKRTLGTYFVTCVLATTFLVSWMLLSHVLSIGSMQLMWWTVWQLLATIITTCIVIKVVS